MLSTYELAEIGGHRPSGPSAFTVLSWNPCPGKQYQLSRIPSGLCRLLVPAAGKGKLRASPYSSGR